VLPIIKLNVATYAVNLTESHSLLQVFFNYISGGAIAPPGKEFASPVKPFLPPKCEAELLMIELSESELVDIHRST
jgi:hypothetical protein